MAKNAVVHDSNSDLKQGFIASETANRLEGFQIHKYRPEKSGHGFAAEDANAFEDRSQPCPANPTEKLKSTKL